MTRQDALSGEVTNCGSHSEPTAFLLGSHAYQIMTLGAA